jgi:hypothetical protein
MIKTLFPNNDAVFKDDSAHIHTFGTVQSWIEEHEDELQHLPWPELSPNLDTTEPLWAVLETTVRNRFLSPTSLKQLLLQEEWYNIPLEISKLARIHSKKDSDCTVGKRWSNAILIRKMRTVSVACPLFCPAPVYRCHLSPI